MPPQTTESRLPVPHEWRRHSLVRVRRPAWAAHAPEAAQARTEAPSVEDSASKSHTTHNDIAW
jgi:hypothetical protein